MGPRGTYVHVGSHGFRYSQRIDPAGPRKPKAGPRQAAENSPRSVADVGPRYVSSTADDLLSEIREKAGRIRSINAVYVCLAAAVLVALIAWASEAGAPVRWGSLAAIALLVAALPYAAWWDRTRLNVRILYDFDPLGEHVREAIERLISALSRSHAIWHVRDRVEHGDWRRNAGAGTSVDRQRVTVGWSTPEGIETNVRVGMLGVGHERLYFFPDRILIYGIGPVRSVPYRTLNLSAGSTRFVEEHSVPRDSHVVGRTWRFVNKDGSPDRRFANNYQMPITLYGDLYFTAACGFGLHLQTSNHGLAEATEKLLTLVREAIVELESRPDSGPRLAHAPTWEEDPAPFVDTGMSLARRMLDVLSFQWLSRLPEWASPIGWGLIVALPIATTLIRLLGRDAAMPGWMVVVAFVLAGSGAGGMIYALLKSKKDAEEAERSDMRSRFQAILTTELRTTPVKEFRFSELVEECGIDRDEADHVADLVFARVAHRVMEDGIVTPAERRKLDVLARALEMAPDRAEGLELDAKEGRFRLAVADVLADGVVTEEEARTLNELRDSLGLDGEDWTPSEEGQLQLDLSPADRRLI